MTRQEFIAHLQALYRVANAADGSMKEQWTVPVMAALTCRRLDEIVHDLCVNGVMTEKDRTSFYDSL